VGTGDIALANVRGWLEGEHDDVMLVKEYIENAVVDQWYNFGWRFPHPQTTGHWYAFYGLHVDVTSIDWFLDQLRHLATVATSDRGSSIRGLFVISDEDKTMSQVRVGDGRVHLDPGDPTHAYLDA